MLKRFVFVEEARPGADWARRFAAGRAAADRWYRGDGRAEPPSAAECRAAFARHMPALLPAYDQACALTGDDALAHAILSHYRPALERQGCSQAIWLGTGGPALVRNYDFPLDLVSDRFELMNWAGRRVICKAQRPWGGCIDGMNEDGLVAALNYGGSAAQGRGFSIILMLRYVLETCGGVADAVEALCRIPIALSQNVVLLDRTGAHATLFLGPDRPPAVSSGRACTNHQDRVLDTAAHADSLRRQQTLSAALDDPATTLADLIRMMLEPPIYSLSARSTTAYTAVYRPAEGRVDYIWPGMVRRQSFDRFEPGAYAHDYGDVPD